MSPARTFFELSCIYWGLVEAWVVLRQLGATKRGQDRNSGLVLVLLIGAGIFAASRITRQTHFLLPGSIEVHLLIGGAVILLGTSFRFWAITTLGRFFRTTVMIQERHEVVTKGPYRFVRHPSYSGILLNVVGVGIGLGNWLAFMVLLVPVLGGLYQRIRVEEDVLNTALGQDYRAYSRRTKRLVPFVY